MPPVWEKAENSSQTCSGCGPEILGKGKVSGLYLEESEILNILKYKSDLLRINAAKKREAYQSLEHASDEITKAIALRGRAAGENGLYKSESPKDLAELLEREKKREKEYRKEMTCLIESLEREKERIQRVWICYQALPLQQYAVLEGIYIHGKLWTEIEQEQGLNHRLLVDIRKKAIENIRKLYASSYTNVNIIQMKYYNKRSEQKKKTRGQIPGQLSLDLQPAGWKEEEENENIYRH